MSETPQDPFLPPPPSAPAPPKVPVHEPGGTPFRAAEFGVSLAEPQRQSLLAVLFLALRFIRNIGIVQIVIGIGFVLTNSPSMLLVAVGALVIAAILLGIAGLSWWRYTFHVADGELRVNKGVLSQQALTVPLDRVQSVSIEQKLLHRVVGLVQVSLDTAGTSSAEFTIDAVDQKVATELQAAAADHASTTVPVPVAAQPGLVDALAARGQSGAGAPVVAAPIEPERVIVNHDARRVLTMALTKAPFSGLAVLAPLFAFGSDIFERIPFDVPEVDVGVGWWLAWFIPVAIVLVLIASIVLNMIQTLLKDWNLTVTRTAAGLRRDAGLLSTTSVASSLPRVQRIEVSEGVIERFVGFHTTTLHNIGDADMRIPGCTEEQVVDLRQLALDGELGVANLDRRVSPLAVFKATRNATVFFVLLAVGLFFAISWWSLLMLLFVPWVFLDTRRRTRLRRWGLSADAIADRTEFVGKRTNEALLRKINSVTVKQSLFERKRGLATVEIQLAGGVLSSGGISIGMIPLAEACAVRDRALFVAETDTRAYM